MKELVELLKQARQDKQVTLKEISDETKIQMHYLAALENGEFTRFAGEVYLKGSLARYADSVGLDVKEVMALYQRLKGDVEPALEEKTVPGAKKPQDRSRFELQGPSLMTGVVLLLILIIAAGIWFALQRERSGEGTNPKANNEYEQPSGDAVQPEPGEVSFPAELVLDRTSDTETVYMVRGIEQIELNMVFYGDCWIRLVIDGEESLERTFTRGEEYLVTAGRSLWIRLGHPPGVALMFGDIEIEEVQRHERSHNFRFYLEQYQD